MTLANIHGRRQKGAALIFSLMVLLVLSVIGISSMQSTTLEEKMAANLGNQNIAFQAGESCLSSAVADTESFTLTSDPDFYQNVSIGAGHAAATYNAQVNYLMTTTPPRNSGYSAIRFDSAHDQYQCDASVTGSGAQATLQQGAYQIIPKN